MSLVGPRPERPDIIEQLRHRIPRIERRLACKPGLTGLAQVRNGYTNDVAGARRKLAFDLRYLRRPSVWTDARLIAATVPKVWDHAAL
jgi:lipopolysaccharide/colanic/teichoic acid biosynthesis glycosyltransferase